jgi:hypothetical protein
MLSDHLIFFMYVLWTFNCLLDASWNRQQNCSVNRGVREIVHKYFVEALEILQYFSDTNFCMTIL